MTERQHWKHARKILCIRLDNMGDVLMTTPAMRALKTAVPGRSITLLASPAGVALAPHMPFVDSTITYNAPWLKNADNCPMADEQTLQALRAGHFDAAVIFTVYSQSPLPAALLCRLAGIPMTLAYCRENPIGYCQTGCLRPSPSWLRGMKCNANWIWLRRCRLFLPIPA
ncbi:glycosyl transferase family protein [Advenella kashmirensis WT001]|uniref:Glycosyl transferase family protein n=1 Tax=Advenella kashmirensis (strain DSM 17095 / LMG 22695 / WT001) TaxID=1036672 RepID=I3UAC7_ADVKW|nr:glycosyl transferase family protein [Advenella kashmirensis]AFK61965.1 glycosyl transferase family protein [Advenella kashmirensis WT001]